MRVYLADEKCRECEGRKVIVGTSIRARDPVCPRCSGVGLEPRELSVVAAIDHDTDGLLDHRKHPEWAQLLNDEPVYRMEEVVKRNL